MGQQTQSANARQGKKKGFRQHQKPTYIWKIFRVHFLVIVQVDVVPLVAKEHDQKNVVECVVVPSFVRARSQWRRRRLAKADWMVLRSGERAPHGGKVLWVKEGRPVIESGCGNKCPHCKKCNGSRNSERIL